MKYIISTNIKNNDLFDIVMIGQHSLPIYYTLYQLIKIIKNNQYTIFTCHVDNKIIGFAIVKLETIKHIHIMSIAILRTYRGNGYGSCILNEIKQQFPQYMITLYVQAKNNTAVSFYIKSDFKIQKTLPDYYQSLKYKKAYYCVYEP